MKKVFLKLGVLSVFGVFSLTNTPVSLANQVGFYSRGEKQPMAVLCDHELFFYTVCGGSGGGCSETSCDKPIE